MNGSKLDKIAYIKQKKQGFHLDKNTFFQSYEPSNIEPFNNNNILNTHPPPPKILKLPKTHEYKNQRNDLLLHKFTSYKNLNPEEKLDDDDELNNQIYNRLSCYKSKIKIKHTNFIPKPKYVEIIPRKIFMCWKTKILPEKMAQNVSQLKSNHPNFEIHVFDDKECLYFIRKYFETDIENAFLYLKPGAYKADLFRLCVLYIHGGIYMDIKYRCMSGFKLDYLLDKEHLVLDLPSTFWRENTTGIYNGLMVSKPKNSFLFECIRGIVHNVNNNYYGDTSLFPTGPGLLSILYFKDCHNEAMCIEKMKDFECEFHWNLVNIIMQNTVILEIYQEYRTEQKECCPNNYYNELWKNNDIYHKNIEPTFFIKEIPSVNNIPLNLIQTWSSIIDIPMEIKKYTEILREQNPEFHYQLYGDTECEVFIRDNFDSTVLNAFLKLIPGAYKADLFRYCILYKLGGIYLDIKYYGVNDFKLIYLTDKEYFVRDIETSGYGIYNAFIITYPGNEILKKAIYQIVENVKNKYYGLNYFCPTGPFLLKTYFESNELELVHREVVDMNREKKYYISYNNGASILYYNYKEYRNMQRLESKKHYAQLWEEKAIYDTRI